MRYHRLSLWCYLIGYASCNHCAKVRQVPILNPYAASPQRLQIENGNGKRKSVLHMLPLMARCLDRWILSPVGWWWRVGWGGISIKNRCLALYAQQAAAVTSAAPAPVGRTGPTPPRATLRRATLSSRDMVSSLCASRRCALLYLASTAPPFPGIRERNVRCRGCPPQLADTHNVSTICVHACIHRCTRDTYVHTSTPSPSVFSKDPPRPVLPRSCLSKIQSICSFAWTAAAEPGWFPVRRSGLARNCLAFCSQSSQPPRNT